MINAKPLASYPSESRPGPNEYRSVAARGRLRDIVYAIRYDSYVADNYIEPNSARRFSDSLDWRGNCTSYLTYYKDTAIGSIRSCVYHPADPVTLPVMEVFDKELANHVGYDQPFIEANRFVVHPTFQRRGGLRARFRIYSNILESAREANVHCIVIGVRPEHVEFYKLLFFTQISDSNARPYPMLKFSTVLLACFDLAGLNQLIMRKSR